MWYKEVIIQVFDVVFACFYGSDSQLKDLE